MKKTGVILLLLLLVGVIALVIVVDFQSKRPERQAKNYYEYNIDAYTSVDPALILYKETKNLRLEKDSPRGICFASGLIYLVSDSLLQVITPEGNETVRSDLFDSPRCVTVSGLFIFIGFQNQIAKYDLQGNLLEKWETLDQRTVLTSLAAKDSTLYVADAGNRKVKLFSIDGKYKGEFDGNDGKEYKHVFIIPSPYFDLAINSEGELWVVNPGLHSFENYTDEGKLRTYWENSSIKIEGFSGCCNPAQMAILPDGSFVTSEKGLVRIKVYKPSGEFKGVVAAPNKFKEDGHAPDLAVTPEGVIYALDYDQKMIRIFQLK